MGIVHRVRARVLAAALLPLLGGGRASAQAPSGIQPQLFVQTAHADVVGKTLLGRVGRFGVSEGQNGWIKVWDLKLGLEVQRFKSTLGFKPLAITPDEKYIILGAGDDLVVFGIGDGSENKLPSGLAALTAVATSPTGEWIACGDIFGSVNLVHLRERGRIIRVRAVQHPEMTVLNMGALAAQINRTHSQVAQFAFSSDSARLAFTNQDGLFADYSLWRPRLLKTGRVGNAMPQSLAFNANGHLLIGVLRSAKREDLFSDDARLQLVDLSASKILIDVPTPRRGSIQLNAGGTRAVVLKRNRDNWGSTETEVRTWDLTPYLERRFPVTRDVNTLEDPIAISDDGTRIFLRESASSNRLVLLDFASQKRSAMDASPVKEVKRAGVFGRYPVAVREGLLSMWNPDDGRPMYGSNDAVAAFTSDGKWTVQRAAGGSLSLIGPEGTRERVSSSTQRRPAEIMIAPNGKAVLWTDDQGFGGKTTFWRRGQETLREVCSSEVSFLAQSKMAVSASGRLVAVSCTHSTQSDLFILETSTGVVLRTFTTGLRHLVTGLSFSPDERGLVLATPGALTVVSVEGAQSSPDIEIPADLTPFGQVVFGSTNDSLIASSSGVVSSAERIQLISIASGKVQRTIEMTAQVTSITNNGRQIVVGASDGSMTLIDATSFSKLVTLIDGGPNAWVAVTPDGLFDGTADAMRWVGWRPDKGPDLLTLDAFFGDYYYPGLVSEILSGSRPKASVDIATMVQVPGLRHMLNHGLAHVERRGVRLLVCFKDPPGTALGISVDSRALPMMRNGFRADPSDPTCQFQKELSVSKFDPEGLAQELRDWKSEPLRTPWDRLSSDTTHATLHVVTIAVSSYPASSGLDPLPYAVPSAQAIEAFFREQRGNPRKPFEDIRVWEGLYDNVSTLQSIRERLAAVARSAGPDDVVLLYLAGHGKVVLGQEMFYFIPVDGNEDEQVRTGLSTAMLAEAVRNLRTRRIVIFIDSCQSGGVIEVLSKIAQAKVRTEEIGYAANPSGNHGVGVHVIAAALPLAYAIGLREDRSALSATILESFDQHPGTILLSEVIQFVQRRLPESSNAKVSGFSQIPLVETVGLDFPIAVK